MNRRKQIEQTSQAFSQPQSQGTIKDQTVNALMNRQQVNPTVAPQGINPGASPQMVNPTMVANQVNPTQMPQQVNPTAAPPIQAAEGGLMSIPVKHFKTQSFAGGGIVAFADGGETEYDPETATRRKDFEVENAFPPREQYKLGNQFIEGPRSEEEILGGLPSITPMQSKRPDDMTPEQAYKRQQEIQKLAGVSDDPFAEVKKRQAEIEARQTEEYKGSAIDRLLAQAEAFATADPAKGLGVAAAASSRASRILENEQRAIRNKQETLNMDIERQMAKEEDARRRGDANGVRAALEKISKDQAEYDKLQMEHDKLNQARVKTASDIRATDISATKVPTDIFNAETQRQNAETQRRSADALASYKNMMIENSKDQKPTAASKEFSRLNDDFENSIFVKSLKSKLELEQVGSDEYNNLINTYNKARESYFKSFMERNPGMGLPSLPMTESIKPKEEPSWWSRNAPEILGGSPSTPAATTMPKGWSVQKNP